MDALTEARRVLETHKDGRLSKDSVLVLLARDVVKCREIIDRLNEELRLKNSL